MTYYRAVAHADAMRRRRPSVSACWPSISARRIRRPIARCSATCASSSRDRRVINTSRLIWLPLLYGVVLPLRPLTHRAQVSQDLDERAARRWRCIPRASPRKSAPYCEESLGDRVRVELGMTYGNPSIAQAARGLGRAEREKAAHPAALSAVLLVDDGFGVRSNHASSAAVALAAGDPFRQRVLSRRGIYRGIDRRVSNSIGRRSARARICCSPTMGFPPPTSPKAIPIKRKPKRPPGWWWRGSGWRRRPSVALLPIALRIRGLAAALYRGHAQAPGRRGVRKLTVVSPSFAVDCLETLEEVAMRIPGQVFWNWAASD